MRQISAHRHNQLAQAYPLKHEEEQQVPNQIQVHITNMAMTLLIT